MEIGIGLPNAVLGAEGKELVKFARRADQAGFSSLGTIDRVAYPNYEPLTTLAAAAAVTESIRLATSILLSPLRANTALFAKQAVTLDNISGGRLLLALAPGGREDDYTASGQDFHTRGKRFDEQLEELEKLWAGEERGDGRPVVPKPVRDGGPELIFGGQVDASFRRTARYGAGWIQGGAGPEAFKETAPQVKEAWSKAGRDGEPRLMALAYYALGDGVEEGRDALRHYYAFLGDYAENVAGSAAADADAVKQYVSAFEEAGCDELILFAAAPHAEQVDLLKEALG
jgi:alkanesulfonate monooxygenase SsuD/methylene tetrahydromethanopterin reductase-like flavin-dependent oxidoreductase (luciferase family)